MTKAAQFVSDLSPEAGGCEGRLQWVDIAKGIGIILVVFGHTTGGLVHSGLMGNLTPLAEALDNAIYLFHMPLFFFLSGLFVVHSIEHGRINFIRARFFTVLYPYVLWLSVQLFIQAKLSRHVNHGAKLSDICNIFWAPKDQFWFLYALAVFQTLALLLYRWPKFLLITALIFLAGCEISQIVIANLDMDHIVYKIGYNFIYFVIGIFLSSRTLKLTPLWWWFLVALVVFSISVTIRLQINSPVIPLYIGIAGALSGITLTIFTSKVLSGNVANFFSALGRASMVIFVLHVIAAAGLRTLMLKLGITLPMAHWVLDNAIGILLPYLIYVALRKWHALSWFGFAPPKRQVVVALQMSPG